MHTAEELKAYFKANHDTPQYIDWNQDIKVCVSGAGYYIGMMTADGEPMCRLSCEYFPTEEDAQMAMEMGNFSAKLWP